MGTRPAPPSRPLCDSGAPGRARGLFSPPPISWGAGDAACPQLISVPLASGGGQQTGDSSPFQSPVLGAGVGADCVKREESGIQHEPLSSSSPFLAGDNPPSPWWGTRLLNLLTKSPRDVPIKDAPQPRVQLMRHQLGGSRLRAVFCPCGRAAAAPVLAQVVPVAFMSLQ